MKYALSKGSILRHEWFGCLCYQAYSGRFWQLNKDAFEILRCLKFPMTAGELKYNLNKNDLDISDQELFKFLSIYKSQGLISQRDEASEILIFNENQIDFREDCLSAPSTVTIYITDYCPKCCRHCATNAHMRINQDQELKLDDWVEVLIKLREAGVLVLVFSGGEPLAVPGIENILKLADDMQFGLSLLTDYDDVSNHQITSLSSLRHPLNIQTSLDGAKADTHDFIRGKGSFVKTLRRLKLFQSAGIIFSVSVSVHKKNISELNEIADLAYTHGASYIYLNAVAPYGRAKETMVDLLLDDDELKFMAQACLRWTTGNKIKLRNPYWIKNLHRINDGSFHPFRDTLSAMSLGIYNFTINSRGKCYLDAKQRAEDFLFLGDIRKDDIYDMWNDPRLDELRKMKKSVEFTYAKQSKIEAALASI